MKKKFKYFSFAIATLLMVGFASCSKDDTKLGVEEIETDGTKMQLVVNMPTGASVRSTTGTADVGSQPGTETENKANSVLLSVFDAGGNFVASYRPTLKVPTTVGDKVSYVSDVFEANALKLGKSYKVYVYINPYPEMELKAQNPNEFFKPWDKAGLTEEERYLSVMEGITINKGFLMSNATTVEAKEVKSSAIVKTTPFTIVADVERVVARFDYTAKNAENTYEVGGESSDVSVKFTHYKLLNTSKQFYHLKRINTTAEGTQGGAETADNYVMDTDWEQKKKVVTSWAENEFNNNFYFNLKSDHVTGYKTLGISTTDAQNLAYVIENTLPLENQSKKGLATAVVFKGHLVFDQKKYGGGDGLYVYVWQNKLYGTWEKLPAGVRGLVGSTVADRTTANLVKAGITSYSWDATLNDNAGGYPVYYVYYNRHNDNNDSKKTGPMEFAVVRNNVYKLSISKVNLFGHSNDPQIKNPTNADPNPELPQDDIERDNIYMEVTANVLPWTVRTNAIEF